MLVVSTDIIHDPSFTMVKQQHTAQHISFTAIPDHFWSAARVANRDPEMVIIDAMVIGYSRLCAGKDENP